MRGMCDCCAEPPLVTATEPRGTRSFSAVGVKEDLCEFNDDDDSVRMMCNTQLRIEMVLASISSRQSEVGRAVAEMHGVLEALVRQLQGQDLRSTEKLAGGDAPLVRGWTRNQCSGPRRSKLTEQSTLAAVVPPDTSQGVEDFAIEPSAFERPEYAMPSKPPRFSRGESVGIQTLPQGWPETVPLRGVLVAHDLDRSIGRSAGSMTANMIVDKNEAQVFQSSSRWQCFILHPSKRLKVGFDVVSMTLLAVDLTLIPVLLAWDSEISGPVLAFSIFTSIFWAQDILVNFFSGYYRAGGEVEMRPAKIALHYVQGWFLMDVGIVLCDWLSLLSTLTEGAIGTADTFALIRFAKLSRLLRVFALLRMIRLARISDELMDKLRSHETRLAVKIVMILMLVMWVNHLISCLWFAVGRLSTSDIGTRWIDTGLTVGNHTYIYKEQGGVYQYASSLHWSIAQMTLGAIDITASNTWERIFNIAMLLVGLLFSSTLVSSLSATMVDLRMRVDTQNKQLRILRQFLRQEAVDTAVAHRVVQQAAFRIKQRERITESDVSALSLLSTSLRAEVRFQMFKESLCAHPLFNVIMSLTLPTAREVCSNALEFLFSQRGDDIFAAGCSCGSAYYLVEGRVTYVQDPETSAVYAPEHTAVSAGKWLCEAALWTKWIHVGTAFVDEFAQVMSLDAEETIKSLRKHRLVEDVIQSYARIFHERLKRAKPPSANWPTDLEVDNTEFGNIVVSMNTSVRVVVSMEAFAKISRPGMFRRFDTDHLKRQILDGECALWMTESGAERVVCLLVFQVSRSPEDECVLVQVGKIDGTAVVPVVQLPGGRFSSEEEEAEVTERLLFDELGPLAFSSEIQGYHKETFIAESPSIRMRTKYLKTVCRLQLTDAFEWETCAVKTTSEKVHKFGVIRKNIMQSTSSIFDIDAPMGKDKDKDTDKEGENEEGDDRDRVHHLHQLSGKQKRPVVCRIVGQARSGLYTWLTPDALERLKRNEEELIDWISSLEIPERVRSARAREVLAVPSLRVASTTSHQGPT